MDNFYMILPSNVESSNYFPENRISNYVTKVPQRVALHGNWVVGLAEISYTYSWLNFPDDVPLYIMLFEDQEVVEETVYLPRGHYATSNTLVDGLNEVFRCTEFPAGSVAPKAVLYGDRICILNGKDNHGRLIHVKLPHEFAEMLSIPTEDYQPLAETYFTAALADAKAEIPSKVKQLIGKVPPDMDRGVHSLYLYCDIIKPTFVGNTYSQILRVVEIPKGIKPGHQVNIKYPSPFYMPLLANEFENVQIHLKDDAGEDINFEYGRVIVTLHFRKTKNQ